MANHMNRLSMNKRPMNFLSSDKRSKTSFESVTKKAKLDITLTQSIPSISSTKYEKNLNLSTVDLYDDVWEEELSEDVVEECFLLASQASQSCPEDKPETRHKAQSSNGFYDKRNVQGGESDKNRNFHFKMQTKFVEPVSAAPHTKLNKLPTVTSNLSNTSVSTTLPYCSNVPKASNAVKNTKENKVQISGSPLTETLQKLQVENEKLQDNLLAKEGEVSILRSQIKKLQQQLEEQHIENEKEVEQQSQRFNEKINYYKKELDHTKTELQFKIIEATAATNHSKFLESTANAKLIESENNLSSKGFGKQRPLNLPDHKQHSSAEDKIAVPKFHRNLQQQLTVSGGIKLGHSIAEFLQTSPQMEVAWLHHIRQSEKFRSTTKVATDINNEMVALHHYNVTLDNCKTQVLKLVACQCIDSVDSNPLVSDIFTTCRAVLCRQLRIMKLMQFVQSRYEWHELDEKVASVVGTLAAPEDSHLMSARQWYSNEEGVESRRACGLLSAICKVSDFASSIISGVFNSTDDPVNMPIGKYSSYSVKKKRKCDTFSFYDLLSFKKDELRREVSLTDLETAGSSVSSSSSSLDTEITEAPLLSTATSSGVDAELHLLLKKPPPLPDIMKPDPNLAQYSDYDGADHGFLQLCLDIVTIISIQRWTQKFVGLLTGIVFMLNSVSQKRQFSHKGMQLLFEIIKQVIFCCPQVDVVRAVTALLASISQFTPIMDALCHGSSSDTFIERHEVTYFTRDSCILQVFFRLMPNCKMSVQFRTEIFANLIDWLSGFIYQSLNETQWLRGMTNASPCNCKAKLIHCLVSALYESFCDFQDISSKGDQSFAQKLGTKLSKGIRLLHCLLQQDERNTLYLDGVEGQYEMFLSGLRDSEHLLPMSAKEKIFLNELLDVEIHTCGHVITPPCEDVSENSEKFVSHIDDSDLQEKLKFLDNIKF